MIFIIVLFCLLHQKHIKDKKIWLFFILLYFVKMFVGYWSVFNQYIYYHDLFCLGTAQRICNFHRHMWVRYFDTTKNMVWCMSLILTYMTSFSVYTICISEHYRDIVSYSPTPVQQVSVILWNITLTVWSQSQVHCVTYYFVWMHDIFTSNCFWTNYTVIILSYRAHSSDP